MGIAGYFLSPCEFETLFLALRTSHCPEKRRQPPSIYCFLRTDLDAALRRAWSSVLWSLDWREPELGVLGELWWEYGLALLRGKNIHIGARGLAGWEWGASLFSSLIPHS